MSIKFGSKHTITYGVQDTITYNYTSKTIKTEDTVEVELTDDSKLSEAYGMVKKSIVAIHKQEVAKAYEELKEEVNARKLQEEKEKEEEELRIQKEKEANRLPETKEEAEKVMINFGGKDITINEFINKSTLPQLEETLNSNKDVNPKVYRALLIMLNKYKPAVAPEVKEESDVAKEAKQSSSQNTGKSLYATAYNFPTPSFCSMKGKNKDVRILGNCTVKELEWIVNANKSSELERKYASIILASKSK